MRILSGLAGKMAPVAGPRGKAVPTPPVAFTPVQHRVTPVSQRRRGDSRAAEVQQQAGAVANRILAPHNGSVESEAGRGNKSCSGSCSPSRDSSGVGTSGSCRMERGTGEQLSTSSGSSNRDPRDAAPSKKGLGTDERQSTSCRGRSRDSKAADPSKKGRGAREQQTTGSRSSRSQVRQYRKRVCVRWGSLQWSLALVLVVRSAASCQDAAHHHHHAVATTRPLTVA